MSNSQRRKGSDGEREVARILSDTLGVKLKRNLGQARDGGDDITLPKYGGGRFRVEVKRRDRIACGKWLEQATKAARNCVDGSDVPVVLMRADAGRWMALMDLQDWMPMLGGELGPEVN